MHGNALKTIATAGIPVQQCTPHHFKYGPWNFYPKRGIIHRDGSDERLPERGVDAFIAVCKTEIDGAYGTVTTNGNFDCRSQLISKRTD